MMRTCVVLMRLAAFGAASVQSAAAFAQAAPIVVEPFARPLTGQVSANTSLSQARVDNSERTIIVPSVRTVYDTNVLRRTQPQGGDTDNLRVTPGLDISLRRSFGRFALNVGGSAGYDFNSRYRFLNRARIDFTGGLRAPVGAICSANLTASYDQYQFDQADLDQTAGATTRNQNYDLGLGCARSAGFSPVAGVAYRASSSSGRAFFNFTRLTERAGVSYARPSLGTVTLSGSLGQLRRPNIAALTGVDDGTNVATVTLGINRAVSPRIQFSASVGYTRAKPVRGGVNSFAGLSYDGRAVWNITPRFVLDGSALRQVTNENGISATYVIRDDYRTSLSWQFSQKSRIQASASHTVRDFRGEGLTPTLSPILNDRTDIIGLNYGYDIARRLRLGLGVSQRWRDADNPIYDYNSTIVSASLGARF